MTAPLGGKCRHRRSWIMASGLIEWCYSCGAVRVLKQTSPCASIPASTWTRPVGSGENPYNKVRVLKLPAWAEQEDES